MSTMMQRAIARAAARVARVIAPAVLIVLVAACSSNNPNADIPRSSSTSTSSTTTSTTTTTVVSTTPAAPPPQAPGPIKAGTICTQLGEVGVTITGVPMTCLDHSVTGHKPYKNGRYRWTG